MSKKNLMVLGVILVALIAAFLIQKTVTRPSKNMQSLTELKIAFDPQAVKSIEVFKQDFPDSGVYFEKRDTSWVVTNEFNAPAKSEEVEKILTDLNLVSGSVRGESEDLYPDFSITDRDALQIKLLGADKSPVTHIYVGKGGPDGKSCFVRLPGSPKVYWANGNFISRFAAWNAPPNKKLPTDRWLNMALVGLGRDAITSFKIRTPKTEYEFAAVSEAAGDTLTPTKKVWTQVAPTKGMQLDASKIDGLKTSVANIRGAAVAGPDDAAKADLARAPYSVWASDSLGNQVSIRVSDKINEEEDRLVSAQGRENIYKMNKSMFERIFVTPFEKPKNITDVKDKSDLRLQTQITK